MVTNERNSPRVWSVAEAKARQSEVLRRPEDEGPQRIGIRKEFVVVPARIGNEQHKPRQKFGQWLVANLPRAGGLEFPPRDEGQERVIPFSDWTEEDWKAFDQAHFDRTGDE